MASYIITYTITGFDRLTTTVEAPTYTMALLEFAMRFPSNCQLIAAVPA